MPGIEQIINDGYEKQGIFCDYTGKWCDMKNESCRCYCTMHETCDCMCVPGEEDYPEVTE